MALRIAVNEELSVLDRFLDIPPWCMTPGARVAILSIHSGEDRRSNPRSACAKLRWAMRSDKPLGG